ncbi:hypothetical protein niasHS_017254 [Heterodera schachtii]|uniref:Piezo non-specific cation channel cap domain-containing protein n=1 Tax=Heterodera schachtii TaxID=97005 RepID=A0ABD2I0F3_HETSC
MNEHKLSDYESDRERDKNTMDFCDDDENKMLKKFEIMDEKPKIVRSKLALETINVKEPINELVVVERGEAKETVIKNMMSLPVIIVLILLVWSPIIAFALINAIGKVQSPDSVTLIASLEGYPPIYKMKVQGSDEIKNIEYAQLEELKKQFGDLTERIKNFNDGLGNRAQMAVAFINQYSHTDVLKVRFRPESEIPWQIPPDSLDALKAALNKNSTIKFNFHLEFIWPSPDGEKDPQKHSKTFTVDENSSVLHDIENNEQWANISNALPLYLFIPSQGEDQATRLLHLFSLKPNEANISRQNRAILATPGTSNNRIYLYPHKRARY